MSLYSPNMNSRLFLLQVVVHLYVKCCLCRKSHPSQPPFPSPSLSHCFLSAVPHVAQALIVSSASFPAAVTSPQGGGSCCCEMRKSQEAVNPLQMWAGEGSSQLSACSQMCFLSVLQTLGESGRRAFFVSIWQATRQSGRAEGCVATD